MQQDTYRFGIEEEFALVEDDFRLSNRARDLIECVPEPLRQTQIKTDLHYCIVENSTGICSDFGQAHRELVELRAIARDAAAQIGCRLLPVGVHPTSLMAEGELVETDRYLRLIAGGALRGDGVHYGQHCHVNIEDREERVQVVNRLRCYIPHIIAVSANSPLYAGKPNGKKSIRMHFYDPVYSSGPPPAFKDWDDLNNYLDRLAFSGVRELRDIYADIRLRTKFPTFEVRCIDTQTTVRQALEVFALVYALAVRAHRELDRPYEPPLHDNDLMSNRALAIEYGLAGNFYYDGREVAIKDDISDLIGALLNETPEAADYLLSLRERVSRGESGAEVQLGYFANGALDREGLFAALEGFFAEDK